LSKGIGLIVGDGMETNNCFVEFTLFKETKGKKVIGRTAGFIGLVYIDLKMWAGVKFVAKSIVRFPDNTVSFGIVEKRIKVKGFLKSLRIITLCKIDIHQEFGSMMGEKIPLFELSEGGKGLWITAECIIQSGVIKTEASGEVFKFVAMAGVGVLLCIIFKDIQDIGFLQLESSGSEEVINLPQLIGVGSELTCGSKFLHRGRVECFFKKKLPLEKLRRSITGEKEEEKEWYTFHKIQS
jgi:hypothetical protein